MRWMKIPDWLVYAVVLAVVVAALFSQGDRPTIPPSAGDFEIAAPEPGADSTPGPLLREPNPFDERVLVQVGSVQDGVGTAFAINRSGLWLTARHVVDGCANVGLSVGDGRMILADEVRTSATSDLALLVTDRAPTSLQLDLERPLRVGEAAYHVGYPQGRAGEASSRLLERSSLVTRGRYTMEEQVLAWGETGRSKGLEGTLSGMSGGPVFDASGAVVGVTVAESPRRGRIYTAAPDSIRVFLEEHGVIAPGGDARPLAAASLPAEAERLRRERGVVQVICRAQVR